MREILFRGKCVEIGIYYKRWIEGFYGEDNGKAFIAHNTDFGLVGSVCDPDTIGQYTGLTDKNGTRIFEGDIINGDSEYFTYSHPYGTIVYDSGEFLIAFDEAFEDVENLGAWANDIEVIGNVHDNPELLKGE